MANNKACQKFTVADFTAGYVKPNFNNSCTLTLVRTEVRLSTEAFGIQRNKRKEQKLAVDEDIFFTEDDNERVRQDKAQAPELFELDCGQLPFERMGDDHFELLVADIYRAMADDGSENWYDTVSRLNDGADQGRDVILFNSGIPVGVIQCKRLKKPLDLDALIYEICKFFLYAHIRPQIVPMVGKEFRYYVAVADSVSTHLFEFMQGTGRKRFEKLRTDFQSKCVSVRLKSKTLNKHEKLKDLTPEQLCDLVWHWIDNLKTAVLKKDSLSSIVAKYPTVKNTYFKLDSNATEILDSIRGFLATQGSSLSANDTAHLKQIRTEYINYTLSNNDRLNLGLLQGSDIVSVLTDMLTHGGALENNFGSRAVVLLAGSVAASPEQWNEIDQLVKAYRYPLLFMAGCGVVSGSLLSSWMTTDGMSWIDTSWKPAAAQKYNAGWCWMTHPDEDNFKCYVLVENEPGRPDVDCGNFSLRLAFKDVIVWPTLGNDFTNSISKANSQIRRIITGQTEDKLKRRNLILVSQHVSNLQDFVKSVGDYHAQRLLSPIAIAAANSRRLQDCKMQLHSGTGVFPAIEYGNNSRASPPTMQPGSRVMRRSTRGGLTFTIKWDASLTLERVVGYRLSNGSLQEDLEPEALEFHELFDRHPPQVDCLDLVRVEIDLLKTLVQEGKLKNSPEFTYQTRYGVQAGPEFTLDELTLSGKYVMKAVQALSYLKCHKNSDWIIELGKTGHLQFRDPVEGTYNIMAWTNDEYRVRNMCCDLYLWAREAVNHPNLVVFAQGKGRVTDEKPTQARYDITAPPMSKNSFTDIELVNKVYFFALDEIESIYNKDDSKSVVEFMNEISARRKLLDAQ